MACYLGLAGVHCLALRARRAHSHTLPLRVSSSLSILMPTHRQGTVEVCLSDADSAITAVSAGANSV
jgi:hypothetical protein